MQQIRQGDEAIIVVSTKETYDTANKIVAGLYVNDELQAKYSSVQQTGYGKLSYNTNNNEISVYVTRDQSKEFPVGKIKLYVTHGVSDSNYDDGVRTESDEFVVGKVSEGKLLDESL